MSPHPISRFPIPNSMTCPHPGETARGSRKGRLIPRLSRPGHRPEEFRAFFAYHDALMERQEGFPRPSGNDRGRHLRGQPVS